MQKLKLSNWICLSSVVLLGASIEGCTTVSQKSVEIEPGSSKEQVIAAMGTPQDRQFNGTHEAWQYCSTGLMTDSYVVVWFNDGKVTGLQSYKVTESGLCDGHFATVDWTKAPDISIEITHK